MVTLSFLLLTVLLAIGTILLKKQRSPVEIIETITLSMILVNVGMGGLYAFIGHAFMADDVARRIGWQPGSPFQLEIAAANLAFGILGIMSFRFRGNFWLAAVSGYAVFLLGAACVHVRDSVLNGNYAEYNSGVFLFLGDIFIPILLMVLVVVHRKMRGKEKSVTGGS